MAFKSILKNQSDCEYKSYKQLLLKRTNVWHDQICPFVCQYGITKGSHSDQATISIQWIHVVTAEEIWIHFR